MKCKKCNTVIPEKAKFCPKCGTKVSTINIKTVSDTKKELPRQVELPDTLTCRFIRRYGYGGMNAAIFPMNAFVDNKTIKIFHGKILDPLLFLLSLIPFVSIVVSVIRTVCEAIINISRKKQVLKTNTNKTVEVTDNAVITTITISNISQVYIYEKHGTYEKLTRLFFVLPIANLFIFSIGSVVIKIIYKDDKGRTKKEKFSFTNSVTALCFIAKIQSCNPNAIYYHEIKKSFLSGFFNVLIALAIFIMMLFGTVSTISTGELDIKTSFVWLNILICGFWIPLIVIIISKLKGEKYNDVNMMNTGESYIGIRMTNAIKR